MSILEREVIERHEYNTLNLANFRRDLKSIIRDEDIIFGLFII